MNSLIGFVSMNAMGFVYQTWETAMLSHLNAIVRTSLLYIGGNVRCLFLNMYHESL